MPTPRELIDQGIRYETGGVLERALESYRDAAAQGGTDPRVLAEALRRTADVLRSRCQWPDAIESARASAVHAREHHLEDLHAEALNAEAAVHQSCGDMTVAEALYLEMLSITDNPRIRGIALQNLGTLAGQRGDHDEAERRFVESFECFQRAGYHRGMVFSLNNYGRAALDRNANETARGILERAEIEARDLMDLDLLAVVRINLAESLLRDGNTERAEELASAALGYFGNTENHWRRLECLRLMGDIARTRGRLDAARRFLEAALRLAEQVDARFEIDSLRRRIATLDVGV